MHEDDIVQETKAVAGSLTLFRVSTSKRQEHVCGKNRI